MKAKLVLAALFLAAAVALAQPTIKVLGIAVLGSTVAITIVGQNSESCGIESV